MLKAVILVGGDRKGNNTQIIPGYIENYTLMIWQLELLFDDSVISYHFFLGTRFRPLSLDIPKPLFPIGGLPIIEHHILACSQIDRLEEVLIIGSYQHTEMKAFLDEVQSKYKVKIRYLQEFVELGTAGGLYHFRDQIRAGNPEFFFLINGDVCADFPLSQLYDFHVSKTGALVSLIRLSLVSFITLYNSSRYRF